MINLNFGFRDLRTLGELAIGAEPPLNREAAPSSPKFGLPGTLGAVSTLTGGAAKMTSGAFAAAKLGLEARESAVAFSSSLTDAAKGFNAAGTALQKGHTSIQDVTLRSTAAVKDGEFTSASDLAQFSGMRAGNISPSSVTAFATKLKQREARIAAMAGKFASIASAVTSVGVIIKENRNRIPNPQKDEIDRPSGSRLSMGGAAAALDNVLRDKRKLLAVGIAVGSGAPSFWTRYVTNKLNPLKSFARLPGFHAGLNMVFTDKVGGASAGGSWSEPPSPYAAQYPHNHARQTASGHVEEWDDTPGAERVHIFHRSGSFVEMHPDGKVVYKSMSHGYQISMGDHNVKVKGDCNFSVDGNATIHSKGEVHLQGDEGINLQTKKDFNVFAENINLRARDTSRLDGRMIDLRSANLRGVPILTMAGPAGGLIMSEFKRDYPLMGAQLDTKMRLRRQTINAARATIASQVKAMNAQVDAATVAGSSILGGGPALAAANAARQTAQNIIHSAQQNALNVLQNPGGDQ